MKPKILRWDICANFHGMNDFGHDAKGGFSRSYTYTGECYREKKCHRKGKCVVAILAAGEAAKKEGE